MRHHYTIKISENSSLEREISLMQKCFRPHFSFFFWPQNIHCVLFSSSNFTSKLFLPKQHFFEVASQYRSIMVAEKLNKTDKSRDIALFRWLRSVSQWEGCIPGKRNWITFTCNQNFYFEKYANDLVMI